MATIEIPAQYMEQAQQQRTQQQTASQQQTQQQTAQQQQQARQQTAQQQAAAAPSGGPGPDADSLEPSQFVGYVPGTAPRVPGPVTVGPPGPPGPPAPMPLVTTYCQVPTGGYLENLYGRLLVHPDGTRSLTDLVALCSYPGEMIEEAADPGRGQEVAAAMGTFVTNAQAVAALRGGVEATQAQVAAAMWQGQEEATATGTHEAAVKPRTKAQEAAAKRPRLSDSD